MNRRIIGVILAVVLGIGGTFALVKYVQSARDDAAEPEPTETILVVQDDVAQGASLDEINSSTELTEVPERLVATGAMTTLDGVSEDLVAGVALEPGEQLLRSRLVAPSELVSVDVPSGLQELTVAFDPERAVGGQVEPGETVGIVLSFEPFEIAAASQTAAPDGADPTDTKETATTKTPNTTHLTLNQVLVTSVQLSRSDAERTTETRTDDESDDQPVIAADVAEAPGDRLLVTFAVTSPEAEQIVFAAEFGRIWLTGQNAATDESNTRILTLEQVYIEVPR